LISIGIRPGSFLQINPEGSIILIPDVAPGVFGHQAAKAGAFGFRPNSPASFSAAKRPAGGSVRF